MILSRGQTPQSLSLLDQTLLTYIFQAYETTCIVVKEAQCPSFPSLKHSSLHTFLNEYTDRQKGLVRYFKLIPEFDQLSMCDKIHLIRDHFCITLLLNEATLSSNISSQLIDSITLLFNTNISTHLVECIKLLYSYNNDRMLLKILLIVKALSCSINRYTNDIGMNQIYDNTLAIFAAQNIYVELLWRYLLSRLPSELHVTKFYSKLIRDLLFVQRASFIAESYINSLSDEIQKMEPLIQSMWLLPSKEKVSNMDVSDIA